MYLFYLIIFSKITLTIDQAIDIALKNNKTIQISLEKLKQKELDIKISFSNFLPTVDIQGTWTHLGDVNKLTMYSTKDTLMPIPVYDIYGNPIGYTQPIFTPVGLETLDIEMGKSNNYLVRTTLKQPLFTGGKLLNAYLISKLNYEIEKENYFKQVKNLKLQITQLFYSIISTEKSLKFLKESYHQTNEHLNQVEKLFSNGFTSKLDLLNTKTALLNMKTQLLNLENALNTLRNSFKMLVSLSDDSFELFSDLNYEEFNISKDELIELALKNSNDLNILKKTKELLKKAKSIEVSNLLPNIFALFNYDYLKPQNLSNQDWGSTWNFTIGFSMNIFNGFSKVHKINSKNLDIKQIDFTMLQYEEFLKNEIDKLFSELNKNKEILIYQKDVIANCEEALKIAEDRYNNGLITNIEYTDTQLLLLQSKTEYIKTLTNYIITKTNIEIMIEEVKL